MRIIGIFPLTCLVFGGAVFFHDFQSEPSIDNARANSPKQIALKTSPGVGSQNNSRLALAADQPAVAPESKQAGNPPAALAKIAAVENRPKKPQPRSPIEKPSRAVVDDALLRPPGTSPKSQERARAPVQKNKKTVVDDALLRPLGTPPKPEEKIETFAAAGKKPARGGQTDDLLFASPRDGGPPKIDDPSFGDEKELAWAKAEQPARSKKARTRTASLSLDEQKPTRKPARSSDETENASDDNSNNSENSEKKVASLPDEDATDAADEKEEKLSPEEEHLKLFVENRYPSANTCGTCHPKHYKEWSVSQHAYAQISPIYLSLNNKINALSNGSNGDFCLRCHSPVGANLGESSFASNLDRHPTSREGITCVVCHRINKAYNKVSGRLALVEGGLTDAVFGPKGNKGVKQTLARPDKFRVVTDPKEPGRQIHKEAKLFNAITTPTFCGSCHDVTLFNGFRLEEAFSEYRVSPAAAKGITCQDCHMGKIQGKASGYEHGPAAVVGDVPTKSRKITNHLFSGPDYPVVHPGIFPHNQEAAAFKTQREWLQFNHRAGWGTDKFEDKVKKGYKFPKAWASVDDRYDARLIINKQLKLLKWAEKKRLEVLRNGFVLSKAVTDRADKNGIKFRVKVKNGTDGHNVPTGFTGERLVWLEVTVTDRKGTPVFRSGDRDPNGDVRDNHSSYVHAGKVDLDPYLFSLQSIFLTQNGRGGEIEHVIPIPFPTFALPRVLPSTASLVFTGEPATERNHKKGIEPNGHRWAKYTVSGSALTGNGPYKATIKLKAQAVPINLIAAIQDVGFDYGMTPREVGDALIAGTQTLWTKKLVFNVHSAR